MVELKYRKKPVVIEAFQWFEGNANANPPFIRKAFKEGLIDVARIEMLGNSFVETEKMSGTIILKIRTLEGPLYVFDGDYIIKGVEGELYPCKPDIFHKTYEKEANEMEINEKNLAKHITSISAMDDLSDLTLKQARAVALLMEHESLKEKSPLNKVINVNLSGVSEGIREKINEGLQSLFEKSVNDMSNRR